jgi:hypothetical protein
VPFPPPKGEGTLPKGLHHIVSFEELNSLIGIDRLFRRFGGQIEIELERCHSNEIGDLPVGGCLAIGLGYNNATWLLGQQSNGLFSIFYENGTDDFSLHDDTGVPVKPHKLLDIYKDEEYALVARIVVKRECKAVPYLICAGHTASGTVVACRFLAEHWREMFDRYKSDGKRPDAYNLGIILVHPAGAREGWNERKVCFRGCT